MKAVHMAQPRVSLGLTFLFLAASGRTIGQLGATGQLVAGGGHGEEKGIAQEQGLVERQRSSVLVQGGGLPQVVSALTGAHELPCPHGS